MLGDDQFTFPSGYAVKLGSIVNGFITVDLIDGGDGSLAVFRDIFCGNFQKIAQRKEMWQETGIKYEYVESTTDEDEDEDESRRLRLPIHNLNDVLFAHIFQSSNFGNRTIDSGDNYGTILVYAGHKECAEMYSSEIPVDDSNFLAGMAELQEQAEAQRQLGHRYMRVGTRSSEGGHAENIDIEALLAVDRYNMETGKVYAIGDRNAWGRDMSQDIPLLAVRKVAGTSPTYEFGTLDGSKFKKEDVSLFKVCATGITERDAQFWEKFKP
jgi:hypothetical protein